jgi:hypothetical protein
MATDIAHYQDRMSRGVAYKLMCRGESPKVVRKIDALMFGKSSCGRPQQHLRAPGMPF